MEAAQAARTRGLPRRALRGGLRRRGSWTRSVDAAAALARAGSPRRPDDGSARRPTSPPSTREGRCASVTCSNGTGSGVFVPGTGSTSTTCSARRTSTRSASTPRRRGARMPSMMSPTVVLRDGELEAGLGSGGSNRIRSAILQMILRARSPTGMSASARRWRPAGPLRGGIVQAEPGSRPRRARAARGPRLRGRPLAARRTSSSAASRRSPRPGDGELSGGGDPRRGGAVAYGVRLASVADQAVDLAVPVRWPARRARASAYRSISSRARSRAATMRSSSSRSSAARCLVSDRQLDPGRRSRRRRAASSSLRLGADRLEHALGELGERLAGRVGRSSSAAPRPRTSSTSPAG